MITISHMDQLPEKWRDGVETRMHVSAANGAAQLCIFEQWIAPSAGAPAHFHAVEEVLTAISGEADLWIEDEHTILTAGHSVIVPAHRKHGFRNIGQVTLHMRAVLASPTLEAIYDVAGPVQRWQPVDQS
jgi:quercetin dioxygenase-like cupin family protein